MITFVNDHCDDIDLGIFYMMTYCSEQKTKLFAPYALEMELTDAKLLLYILYKLLKRHSISNTIFIFSENYHLETTRRNWWSERQTLNGYFWIAFNYLPYTHHMNADQYLDIFPYILPPIECLLLPFIVFILFTTWCGSLKNDFLCTAQMIK